MQKRMSFQIGAVLVWFELRRKPSGTMAINGVPSEGCTSLCMASPRPRRLVPIPVRGHQPGDHHILLAIALKAAEKQLKGLAGHRAQCLP